MSAPMIEPAVEPMATGRVARTRAYAERMMPGVLLAATVATASTWLAGHYGAPATLFALLLGMAFHFLNDDPKCKPGVQLTSTTLLRLGVALLGARVTFGQIAGLGVAPIVLVLVCVAATIASGLAFSKLFGRSWRFGLLTGGAVAICGASAALAIAAALPKGGKLEDRDVLFTVIAVTTLSTIAMIAYPIAYAALGFDAIHIGMLLGATIHDVAQVVGAGYAVSDEAGNVATYVKLLRVAMLPVVVLAIAIAFRDSGEGKPPFPWFAVAFAVILGINSAGLIPETVRFAMETASRWLLIAAIAALGVKTSLKALVDLGGRHVAVVVGETLFLFVLATVALTFI
ncbi:MAG TPA: putative sulfate exporter family transporter [Azospirillaceae bacterium]|nr:putative sulfate exporter family transporter [Azospirillaceae bacterium]